MIQHRASSASISSLVICFRIIAIGSKTFSFNSQPHAPQIFSRSSKEVFNVMLDLISNARVTHLAKLPVKLSYKCDDSFFGQVEQMLALCSATPFPTGSAPLIHHSVILFVPVMSRFMVSCAS